MRLEWCGGKKSSNERALINIYLEVDLSREGGGSERNVHGTFLVITLICESSLIKLIYDYRTHENYFQREIKLEMSNA